MERQIIFRGKSISDGKWVFGSLILFADDYPMIMSYSADAPVYTRVTEKTIGQYTGVKDKDKKLIFEGDIVHWQNNYKHEFTKKVTFDKSYGGFAPVDIYMGYDCNVLGNIHDNPELLEVKKPEPPKNGLLPHEFRIRALYDNGCMSVKGHIYIAERVKLRHKDVIRVWDESSKLDDEGKRRYGTYCNMDLSILGNDRVYPNYEIVEENKK